MHYVKHGPAPDFLQGEPNALEVAGLKWCDLYHLEDGDYVGTGIDPETFGQLQHQLGQRFGGGSRISRQRGRSKRYGWDKYPVCAYCEVRTDSGSTKPEIDHFRPRSKYPHLTFKWENLLYSCHKCNYKKDDEFPEENGGYVSPSDPDCNGYFDFDFDSCRIRPKDSIDDDGLKLRIEKLICDLKLNRLELTNLRRDIKAKMNKKIRANPGTGLGRLLGRFTSESSQCSSFAKAYKECQSPSAC